MGASGSIALLAAFAPAIVAWSLDANLYRSGGAAAEVGVGVESDGETQAPAASQDAGVAAFAPLSALTSIVAVLAPVLASPFLDAIKSILGALSVD